MSVRRSAAVLPPGLTAACCRRHVAELQAYAGEDNPLQRFYGTQVPELVERDGQRWLMTTAGTTDYDECLACQ